MSADTKTSTVRVVREVPVEPFVAWVASQMRAEIAGAAETALREVEAAGWPKFGPGAMLRVTIEFVGADDPEAIRAAKAEAEAKAKRG